MHTCRIEPAKWPADLQAARTLLRNYQGYLLAKPAGAASICLRDYDTEITELATRWSEPDAVLLLATLDETPVGCVAVRMLRSRAGSAEMKRMWVEAEARGLRLGRQLAEAAICWAREHGADELLLDTVPEAMPEANYLYVALGFEQCPRYNDIDVERVIFMRRPLR